MNGIHKNLDPYTTCELPSNPNIMTQSAQEAAYYKVLGAGSRFVLTVFSLENAFIGLISGSLALAMSQGAAWFVTVRFLDIPFKPFLPAGAVMVVGAVALVVVVGLLSSMSILQQKPSGFLKEQGD